PDLAASVGAPAALSGFATDDGLPLGSALRSRWSKVSGPGEVAFGDAAALATTAVFGEPGIYTLELAADDGVAVSRDFLRVVADFAEGSVAPPSGLRAHWPAEGTGHDVVGGYHALPVGALAY